MARISRRQTTGETPSHLVPTAWQPGQSGNPTGRSKTEAEIAALARTHAPECVGILMEIAQSKKQAGVARVAAVQELLNRAFGKAPQRVVLERDIAGLDNPALAAFVQRSLLEASNTIEADPVLPDDAQPTDEILQG